MAMIITLSTAMMAKGVKPILSTRLMTGKLGRVRTNGTAAFFARKYSTKAPLAH